jgi:hypothetical protein
MNFLPDQLEQLLKKIVFENSYSEKIYTFYSFPQRMLQVDSEGVLTMVYKIKNYWGLGFFRRLVF